MIAYFWLGLALLLSSALADKKEDSGVANDYIDEILNNLKNTEEMVSKLDPIKIPDINEPKLKVWNLWVYGLSSLERSGDCILSYDGEKIKVEVNLAVNDVRVNGNYKVKSLLIWIEGIVRAILSRLSIRLVASFTHQEGILALEDFKVTEFGKIFVLKITGLSIMLDPILQLIITAIANNSRRKITEAVEKEGSKAIAEIFKKTKIDL